MADENKLLDFVRWDDTDPIAVIDQLRARVREEIREGRKVGFAAVLVRIDPTDNNPIYSPCHSVMPAEVVAFCGYQLVKRGVEDQAIPV